LLNTPDVLSLIELLLTELIKFGGRFLLF